MVSMGAALKRQVRFMGKHSIFIGPLAPLLRWLGGIPVERNSHHNFVEQMVQQFADCDDMVLVIAPEGTRSKVDAWKGGLLSYCRWSKGAGGCGSIGLWAETGRYCGRSFAQWRPARRYGGNCPCLSGGHGLPPSAGWLSPGREACKALICW